MTFHVMITITCAWHGLSNFAISVLGRKWLVNVCNSGEQLCLVATVLRPAAWLLQSSHLVTWICWTPIQKENHLFPRIPYRFPKVVDCPFWNNKSSTEKNQGKWFASVVNNTSKSRMHQECLPRMVRDSWSIIANLWHIRCFAGKKTDKGLNNQTTQLTSWNKPSKNSYFNQFSHHNFRVKPFFWRSILVMTGWGLQYSRDRRPPALSPGCR